LINTPARNDFVRISNKSQNFKILKNHGRATQSVLSSNCRSFSNGNSWESSPSILSRDCNALSIQPNGGTMNTMHSFCRRCYSIIPRLAAVMLVALAWSGLAFCGEIHDAAQSGDIAKVASLLKDNPDLVFSKGDNGATPLHNAAGKGHKDVAQLLLANKADVNAKDSDGNTTLHTAAYYGNRDVAQLLLANKADVNAKDSDGNTTLHIAAYYGHKDVAALLLANRADVNAKDDNGSTPLHYAAGKGHKDVAALLLANRADVNAKDSDGATPLHIA